MEFQIRQIDRSVLEKQDNMPARHYETVINSTSTSVLRSLSHMTFNCEDNKTDLFLAVADDIVVTVNIQPRPLPKA